MLARLVCLVGCILIFSRSLAAYAEGPPANRNGLTGQFCTACHRTNPLNSGEGSVRIVGLPSAWAPGESYTLRVVVSHPTAIRWGFEFSATGANGDQAGEIVPGADGRTQVITEVVNTKTVQFIEHNTVGSTIGSPSTSSSRIAHRQMRHSAAFDSMLPAMQQTGMARIPVILSMQRSSPCPF
jgi:hypothetical protein